MHIDAERFLWDHVPEADRWETTATVRDVIEHMLITHMIDNAKQAWRTLEKWCNQGCYTFGCTLDLGWRNGGAPTRITNDNQ